MKEIIIFSPLLLFVFCSVAPIVPPQPTNRIVLAEFFTQDGWSYCALAEQALNSLTLFYGDTLAIVAYNRNFTPSEIDTTRRQYYENPLDPSLVLDGTDKLFIEDTNYYSTYDQHITIAKSATPYFNLGLNARASTNSGTIQLHIVTADTIPEDSIVAFVVICEDSIDGMLKNFNYVCKYLYYFPANLTYPDSLDTTIVFSNTIQPSKMRAVAFIQNIDTKKILQAITKKFEEE